MLKKKKGKKEKAGKENKRLFYLAVLLLAISAAALLSSIFLNISPVLDAKEIYASMSVSGITGLNVDNTALTFGNIMPGTSASRNLIFTNQYGFPVRLEISAEGDISGFLSFERYAYVGADETKEIGINAVAPAGERYADYSGKIIVVVKKAI
ncbi:hypothetical protein HYT92_01110 [Candidatus Pacearchaeota archaeon]|nr:hypothetical protein [Candidatus Pacearchaeota archaeon]